MKKSPTIIKNNNPPSTCTIKGAGKELNYKYVSESFQYSVLRACVSRLCSVKYDTSRSPLFRRTMRSNGNSVTHQGRSRCEKRERKRNEKSAFVREKYLSGIQ